VAGEVRPAPALRQCAQTVGDAHLLSRQYPDHEPKAFVRVAVELRPGAARDNVQDMLRSVTFAFDGLLVTAVLLVIVAVLSARRQSIGVLRALGAPPAFVFVTVWLQGAMLIAAGVLLGVGLGVPLAKAIGAIAGEELGLVVDATIGVPELAYAAVLLGAGSLFAAAPSLPTLRVPVSRLLRAA
jgi:putative ABC transport system permease protein